MNWSSDYSATRLVSHIYDEEHAGARLGINKRCKGVLRLDKLMKHIKFNHADCIPSEGRSLLRMGFTTTRADDGRNIPNNPGFLSTDDGRNVPGKVI